VAFESRKESIATNSPQGRFMLTVFSALSQLEIEVTRQRADEGIAEAKKRGVYTGRKPRDIDPIRFELLYTRWREGKISAVFVQKELGISSPTFYRRVQKWEKAAQA
jgi:DNA invertase Pin-like site-specific DNA recombinase